MTRTRYTEAKDLKRDLMSMFIDNGLGVIATIRNRSDFDVLSRQTQADLTQVAKTLAEARNDPNDLPVATINQLVDLQEQVDQELSQVAPSEPTLDQILKDAGAKSSNPKHSGTFKPAPPRDNWFKRLMRWAREEN